jgi:hypothetical protein
MVEDGRVDGIIAISRALGDWEYKSTTLEAPKMAVSGYPEVKVFDITPNLEFIICACDGIWDCMTSQQACDFVYQAKQKMANYEPKSPGTAKSTSSGSPTKLGKGGRLSKSPPRKGTKNKLENKLESSIDNSKFSGIATVVEMMMDVNCPPNLHATEGLGADNMTCVIMEFNHKK